MGDAASKVYGQFLSTEGPERPGTNHLVVGTLHRARRWSAAYLKTSLWKGDMQRVKYMSRVHLIHNDDAWPNNAFCASSTPDYANKNADPC